MATLCKMFSDTLFYFLSRSLRNWQKQLCWFCRFDLFHIVTFCWCLNSLKYFLSYQWHLHTSASFFFSQPAGLEVTSDQQLQTTCLFSKCAAMYPEDSERVQMAKVTFGETLRMSDHLARHLTCTFMFAPCPTKPLLWQCRRLLN